MMAPAHGAVLLIGAGRMGGALIKGWIAANSFSAIHVVEPFPSEELKTAAAERARLGFLTLWTFSPCLLLYGRMCRSYSLQILVTT